MISTHNIQRRREEEKLSMILSYHLSLSLLLTLSPPPFSLSLWVQPRYFDYSFLSSPSRPLLYNFILSTCLSFSFHSSFLSFFWTQPSSSFNSWQLMGLYTCPFEFALLLVFFFFLNMLPQTNMYTTPCFDFSSNRQADMWTILPVIGRKISNHFLLLSPPLHNCHFLLILHPAL